MGEAVPGELGDHVRVGKTRGLTQEQSWLTPPQHHTAGNKSSQSYPSDVCVLAKTLFAKLHKGETL